QHFVSYQKPLLYHIDFENVPTATAAAQRIRITDQLDPNLDPRTFRLQEIGFGKYRITVPDNRAFYQGRMQLGEELGNMMADITAGLDIATGQVTWTLTAIDPKTGEQPNSASLGLLPPNDETGRGQGYVTYTILPKAGAPTGTIISNKATIIFDTEEPITTNTVTNTLDADLPFSMMTALPATSPTTFMLNWTGDDIAGGAGLQSFDIWYAEGDGPYQPFVTGTTDTTAEFTGENGKTYRFYSIARDNAGNIEAAPDKPDAVTRVGEEPNPAPTISSLSPASVIVGSSSFALTVNGANFVSNSEVRWNGATRPTTFLSTAQLSAMISANDVAAVGSANVTVFTPTPGGGTSNALTFTISPLPNPVPTITNLNPNAATAGSGAFTLTVNGTGFVNGVKVQWNGGDLATTFVNDKQVTATISASLIAAAGSASIIVVNPAPGGGPSNALSFTINAPPAYEADVAPRPNGNGDGKVTIADWVQTGRFVARLDTPNDGSEYQRADCAPKATLGDGKISLADWVQAGRYAAGFDPVVLVGGPTSNASGLMESVGQATPTGKNNESLPTQARTVRAVNAAFRRGQVNALQIELEAQGDENALSFTLDYDPAILGFLDVVGSAVAHVNTTQAATGRIGLALALASGQTYPVGTRSVITLRFVGVGGDADATTQVRFSDQIIKREIVAANATTLPPSTYTNASIAITGRAATHVSAASYAGPQLAAEAIGSAFGTDLASDTQSALSVPLPTILAGTTVVVVDSLGASRQAPLFYVSPTQINYQIPAGTAEGIAIVTITNSNGMRTDGVIQVMKTAPGLFAADASGKGLAAANVVRVQADGSQVIEPVGQFDPEKQTYVATLIDWRLESEKVYLVLYGTGIRNRTHWQKVTVKIDGVEAPVEYSGAQGTYLGLDQINVLLPRSLAGKGDVSIEVWVEGMPANPVQVKMR
ncbi:MAG: IPT/TIG domain-containing protein, partial [Blastocatellia bacterium]|nr:IPT/TIG domain-containing protein [Blastocatellia bacterium]